MSGVKIVFDFDTDQLYILRRGEKLDGGNVMEHVAKELKQRLTEMAKQLPDERAEYYRRGQEDMKERIREALSKWNWPMAGALTCVDMVAPQKLGKLD